MVVSIQCLKKATKLIRAVVARLAVFLCVIALMPNGHAGELRPGIVNYLSFEERLLASLLLSMAGATPEQQDRSREIFESYLRSVKIGGVQRVKVKSLDEFITKWKGHWPETGRLDRDLEILMEQGFRMPLAFEFPDKSVLLQVMEYLGEHVRYLNKVSHERAGLPGNFRLFMAKQALGLFSVKNGTLIFNVDGMRGLMPNAVSHLLENQVLSMDQIALHLGDSIAAKISDERGRRVLKTLFTTYYSNLSLKTKKNIASALLAAPINATDAELFEIVLQSVGPTVQKFFQIVAGHKDFEGGFRKLFEHLEDAVRPMPYSEVEPVIRAELANYDLFDIEETAFKAGTMAQQHRAKLRVNGKVVNVLIRVVRPGIGERVLEDHRALLAGAYAVDNDPFLVESGFMKLVPRVEYVTRATQAEENSFQTAQNQIYGRENYGARFLIGKLTGWVRFTAPKVFPPKYGKSAILVQEEITGASKLSGLVFQGLAPERVQRIVAEKLATLWLKRLFFNRSLAKEGRARFHSDLHSGNFLVKTIGRSVFVYLLDFGMTGNMSLSTRDSLLRLGASIAIGDPARMARVFMELAYGRGELIRLNESELASEISNKLIELKNAGQRFEMNDWVSFVDQLGVPVPFDELFEIDRGATAMNQLLRKSGSDLTLQEIMMREAAWHPLQTSSALRRDGLFTLAEVVKIGWYGPEAIRGLSLRAGPALMCKDLLAH